MGEFERRLRAARAYAGLTQPEMAERLGLGEARYKRIELGQRGLNDIERRGLVEQAADICGLPPSFFSVDFARLEELPAPLAERLARIEELLEER